ncbi:hypothetical protein [Coleofasciculus sp. FACHB-T130]|uniref:hypothetical protein n=1 Tax=Cyanophyceae TaxID=3028117 RepID=UPI0016847AC8|nr:hypothetical protein [Coleofasciculus sp. FACHB-T130]MBD1879881.1 hypothetical protein [Coleofasciculus sp. FACHB-T130]
MPHPFAPELSELGTVEFNLLEELTDEEAATITGGFHTPTTPGSIPIGGNVVTPLEFNDEGGYFITLWLGEEGGYVTIPATLPEDGGNGLQ